MSDRRELFVEVGSEELPAKEVMSAVGSLRDSVITGLDEARLPHGAPRIYATPRRLVLVVPDVEAKQEDVTKTLTGPKKSAGPKALEGFAKKVGLTVDQLTFGPNDVAQAKVEEKGRATSAILPELLTKAVTGIPFKRSMRWGSGDATFARPLQWIVALFGGEVVRFTYGDVESGRRSRGHRFLAPDAFDVEGEAQWRAELQKRFVVADVEARKKMIVDGAKKLAETLGGTIRPDDDLVDEVVQLVEYPVPMLGKFEESFLEIPQEVLISEMREHQRYLSVVDAKGKLLPSFVVVANTTVEDQKIAIDGYRRVLSARFQDGRFFFSEDQKVPLASRIDRLKGMAFHRALGTTYEKVERVVQLAFWLARALGDQLGRPIEVPSDARALAEGPQSASFDWTLARAGYLMKADLTTSMVFEFPELQGVMGRSYALRSGEPEEVAAAIEEHYLPRHSKDALPKSLAGAILGIADRLDTIAGIFATGKGPTGAADPFGLRRAALAVLGIVRDRGWHLSLSSAIAKAIELIGSKRKKDAGEAQQEIAEFIRTRLKGVLTGLDVAADVAEAVLAAGADDAVDAALRADALAKLRASPGFEPVASAFKRVANILKDQSTGALNGELLHHPAERGLLDAANAASERVTQAIAGRDFAAAFAAIADVYPAVDRFFDPQKGVLVMDPDLNVRAQRLALVGRVHRIFAPLADFTKLDFTRAG
jgi:glycyl-tRNA synthetase beta chain